MEQSPSKKLYVVDGSSYIFRAYYGLSTRLRAADGTPTSAVFGFKNMINTLLKQYNPQYLAIIFDAGSRTARHDIYEAYKANRDVAPDDLVPQFSLIYSLVECMNLKVIRIEGVEADDIIGTLAHMFQDKVEVRIISGDKDMAQLVNPNVKMIDTMKNKVYDSEAVKEKFGVFPEQIAEYLALVGDASDNIPGAKGIGGKGAAELLGKYNNIENLKTNLSEIKGKRGENLRDSWDNVDLSLRLTKIDRHIDLSEHLENVEQLQTYKIQEPHYQKLKELFERLGFKDEVHSLKQSEQTDLIPAKSVERKEYQTIRTTDALIKLAEKINENRYVCFDLETDSLDKINANIVGIAVATDHCPAAYIPILHEADNQQLSYEQVFSIIKPIFDNPDITLIFHHYKFDCGILKRYGLEPKGIIEDTMIMSYLISADENAHGLDKLALKLLNHTMIAFKDVAGIGKKQVTFDKIAVDVATNYAAEDADITLQLYHILAKQLKSLNLEPIYQSLEIPLAKVLMKMEAYGVLVNEPHFNQLRERWNVELVELEGKIFENAGTEFNINSPKQLSDILFNRMGIQEFTKKTKTGSSTDASVLEKLAPKYEIAKLILEYRTLAKLLNTYIDKLPQDINPTTKRIHTSFNQTVAATGRLSSNNPNLQNIPIKGKEGKLIRAGFVSQPGYVFMSADYSQIELRVLAHLANDNTLINAFKNDKDIHTETAVAILKLNPSMVTEDHRRLAKAINFGIIYGMGAYRLAMTTGISQAEAKRFIEMYFDQFASIQGYINDTIAFAKKHEYVETILGRKRNVFDINNKNAIARKSAERIAVNTTIQGSAADIIKKAMIDIQCELELNKLMSRMLLQVHDELVFEVENSEIDRVREMIVGKMVNATPLEVPLKVSCDYGNNWDEAHS